MINHYMNEVRIGQRKYAPSTLIRTQVKVLTTNILGTNKQYLNHKYTWHKQQLLLRVDTAKILFFKV